MKIQQFFSNARINKAVLLANLKDQIGEDLFVRLLAKLKEMQTNDPISRGSFHVFMERHIGMDIAITEAIAEELDFPEFTEEELAAITRADAKQSAQPDLGALLIIAAALLGGLNGNDN